MLDYSMPCQQILVHISNLTRLRLALLVGLTNYLIDNNQYSFNLCRLPIKSLRNATLIKFLITQPEIEEIVIEPSEFDLPQWPVDTLSPDILPKLRSIRSPKADILLLVPHHPVSNVTIFGTNPKLRVHNQIAQSLTPLECFDEYINCDSWEQPWES
ncbi:hypothetical protein ACGC1H_002407 [Rhizoctonia solani]